MHCTTEMCDLKEESHKRYAEIMSVVKSISSSRSASSDFVSSHHTAGQIYVVKGRGEGGGVTAIAAVTHCNQAGVQRAEAWGT